MSIFVKHIPCPKCGPVQDRSGNNLGLYSDGHKWCFACGYWEPGNGVISLDRIAEAIRERKKEDSDGTGVALPTDFTHIIPSSSIDWLRKYEISNDEIQKNKIGWSPSYQRLIFPVFDDMGEILMWQGRYFPDAATGYVNPKKPRYYTRGRPEEIDAYYGHLESTSPSCVIVEDCVSAIKVSRVRPTLCLWGSELSMARIRRIARYYTELVIWLDADKARHATRCQVKASPYFEKTRICYSIKDPKEYSVSEIKTFVE